MSISSIGEMSSSGTEGSLISIVIPAFNEEENIPIIASKIHDVMKGEAYEILFVDDGSTDQTLNEIKKLQIDNPRIHYLSFTRNFGHQNALMAGLRFANGHCVISLDADMQHPADLMPEMVKRWREGYEIVFTKRRNDHSLPFIKKVTSSFFYKIINAISDTKIEEGAADFRLLDRAVVNVINESREHHLFLRGYISWMGFRQCGIEYSPQARLHGKTKYSFSKMLRFAIEGLTSFSTRPLRIASILGSVISLSAFVYACYVLSIYFFTDRAIQGWTSVLISILFIGGIQLLVIGILGEYLGKVLMQAKLRPSYIVREKSL